jgi:RNA polymerase sigma-70 factor, ECF subfamily
LHGSERFQENAFQKTLNKTAPEGMYTEEEMPPTVASIDVLSLPRGLGDTSTEESEVQQEVVALFDQLRNPVLRYAISLGLSAPEGEEVTQEVFLALFRHLKLGRSRRHLRGWIFRVAHNLALRQRAATSRLQRMVQSDWMTAENRQDSSPNAEERLVMAARLRRLSSVIRSLPEQERCCLRLRAEGLPYREIAGVLNISLGAVSLSIARSIARLARADSR